MNRTLYVTPTRPGYEVYEVWGVGSGAHPVWKVWRWGSQKSKFKIRVPSPESRGGKGLARQGHPSEVPGIPIRQGRKTDSFRSGESACPASSRGAHWNSSAMEVSMSGGTAEGVIISCTDAISTVPHRPARSGRTQTARPINAPPHLPGGWGSSFFVLCSAIERGRAGGGLAPGT